MAYKTRRDSDGYTTRMQRKNALASLAALAAGFGTGSTALAAPCASKPLTLASTPRLGKPLHPPAHGPVQVAFVIGPELIAIDVFGPMTAFDNAYIGMDMMHPLFSMWCVAATTAPITMHGATITPKYSFDDAPQPHVVVIPEQKSLPATIAWIKHASARADVTMSVCTGAFLAARAGVFDGLSATTHHSGYDEFAKSFPKVTLVRGPRFVENPNVSSSGGESSGIDLALRVVERYYGAAVARDAAYNMEYRRTERPQSANDV
jgi:transcriptional regulator GlxA family with amidase domain